MKVEIIAEIAQGYEGNPKLAELLVKGAILANADSVKMQLVFADELCVPSYPYWELFKSLEMSDDIWVNLVSMVHGAGKLMYFDIYGRQSLDLALKCKADGVKISTTDFYNTSLIKSVFEKFDRVILSTGGVPAEDVKSLIRNNVIPKHLTLMHGFQAEPTEIVDNNLMRIKTMIEEYPGIDIGFMDHSLGSNDEAFHLPLIALGLGVSCIEKHISLDYKLEIEDFISALSVDRFFEFVKLIRKMEPALGSKELNLTTKEIEYKKRAGKITVARHDLEVNSIISDSDIEMKRVNTVLSDGHFPKPVMVIGKTLIKSIKKNQPFDVSILK
jgi:N,N'-diacetyllegionaminate synthase